VAFVPDEEIGLCGAKLMDLEKWKVDFAYTIDCCSVGEIVYETFNAASVLIEIQGVTAHPMSAKGVLVNPLLVGADIMACFDRKQTPEHTDGHDGYWWFWGCEANDSRCTLRMNIRDHSKENYEARKKYVLDVVDMIRVRHPRAKIDVKLTDVYGNIIDALGEDRGPIDMLYQACDELGITPKTIAMRGGTDGSVLSVRGVLTPNYFTGGLNFHSNAEFLPIPSLCKSHAMTMKLIELAAR
jgi:tripeptide aminopeptidase